MTKSFIPSKDLTTFFYLNKNIPSITFNKNDVKTSYDTNFKNYFNKDF